MENGNRAGLACAALFACIACTCLVSCVSPTASARSAAEAYLELPPASWPPECPLAFVDSSGKPVSGRVKAGSLRLLAFGLSATVKDARLEEDGSISAASIVFDATKERRGGKLSLREPRLGPQDGDPNGGIIEFSTPDGWSIGIEGQELGESGTAFSGQMRSRSSERLPGTTASSSARFTGLLLGGKARVDWTHAVVTDINVLLDMDSGEDLLTAGAAAVSLDSANVALSCELRLAGGAVLDGASDPGEILFPLSRIDGGGRILLPAASTGKAGFRLTGGFAVRLSEAVFSKGAFSCSGEVFTPPEWRTAAPLAFPPGGITVRGIRALALSTSEYAPAIELSAFGARIEASGFKLVHSGKARVSFTDAAIVAIGSRKADGSTLRIPLGPIAMENGLPESGERSFAEALRVPGFGKSLDILKAAWGPSGFRFTARAELPGFLGECGIGLPDLSPGPGGELAQAPAAEDRQPRFMGAPYSFSGFRLLPGGSVSVDSLSPSGDAKARLSARNIVVGADGTLFPGFEAVVARLAGDGDFAVTGLQALSTGGVRLAGSMMVGFASEGHIFQGRLETQDLRLSPGGEASIGDYRWLTDKVPAFLGLMFRKVEFAFRRGQAFLVLSQGSFAGRGAWPSGGEMDGLGLNLDTMKYDLSALRFPEPAVLTRPEGRYTLSSFLSAVDDAYLFSGTASLKALPGAPWAEGESLNVELIRLDAYGNIRELRLIKDGKEVDGKAWIRK
jgi:hypothetical protein